MSFFTTLFQTFILVFTVLICILSQAHAGDTVISGFTVTGFRSTVDDYEDEDEAHDYEYTNYGLRLKQKASDFVLYDVSSYLYNKDYREEDDLDNKSKILKGSVSYVLHESEDAPIHLGIRIKYREKRYDNEPSNDYNQFLVSPTVTFGKSSRTTLKFSTAFQNFNYLHAQEKDQIKLSAKIAGTHYPPHKRLKLVASYKIETQTEDHINREKTKHDIFGGFDYIFDHPALDKIMARVRWGQRDTKEDDIRDLDHDYEYRTLYIKTLHTINRNVKTDLKYYYFRKDYVSAELDHESISISNTWRYIIQNNAAERITVGLKATYKDMDYDLKPDNSYEKICIEIRTGYQKKKDWKTALSIKGDFYDYHDSDKDKNRYAVRMTGEKLFLHNAFTLSLTPTYRYTDYKHQDDDSHGSVKIAFSYTF